MKTFLFAAVIAFAGCTEVQNAADSTAREGARIAVTKTLVTRFPQVPKALVTPFTDCIIDHSTVQDIRVFAQAAVVGVEDKTAETVRAVLARPETIQCLTGAAGAAALTL